MLPAVSAIITPNSRDGMSPMLGKVILKLQSDSKNILKDKIFVKVNPMRSWDYINVLIKGVP